MTVAVRGAGRLHVASEARSEPLLPSSVLGMLIFVFTELMFFAGFISAITIVKSNTPIWPPPGQPRLPVEETAFNTAALLLSGVMMIVTRRVFMRDRARAKVPFGIAIALGAYFVFAQGMEWAALLAEGLTLQSSTLGSFFYVIVGVHALHAVAALILLGYTYLRLHRGWLASSQLASTEIFWYFVVGVWPILYMTVYL